MRKFFKTRLRKSVALPVITVLLCSVTTAYGANVFRTYTVDADFDEGTLVNVNHDSPNIDQLQLDSQATPFNFIWIAVPSRNTEARLSVQRPACAHRPRLSWIVRLPAP